MSNGVVKATEPVAAESECLTGENAPASSSMANKAPKRDQWSSKLEFILSCVGYAIGEFSLRAQTLDHDLVYRTLKLKYIYFYI